MNKLCVSKKSVHANHEGQITRQEDPTSQQAFNSIRAHSGISHSQYLLIQRCCRRIPELFTTVRPLETYYKMECLSEEGVKYHLPYIAHSGYAHKPNKELIEPFGFQSMDPKLLGIKLSDLRGKIEILAGSIENYKTGKCTQTEPCFVDRKTGLKILVSINTKRKEIVLAFGDSNSLVPELKKDAKVAWLRHQKAIWHNLSGGFGWCPELYLQADILVIQIIKTMSLNSEYKNYNFVLVGQSLGGSLAQFVGLNNGIKAICYNAVPLGTVLQKEIGYEKLENANSYVTHVSVESDFVSDLRYSGLIRLTLNFWGIDTPANFGARYSIPKAYSKMQDIHSFVLGSAMHSIGYDKRKLPLELKKESDEYLSKLSYKDEFIASVEYQEASEKSFLLSNEIDELYVTFISRLQKEKDEYLNSLDNKDQFIASIEYQNAIKETVLLIKDLKKIYADYQNRIGNENTCLAYTNLFRVVYFLLFLLLIYGIYLDPKTDFKLINQN